MTEREGAKSRGREEMIRYKARCNGLSGNRTHYGRPLAARRMNSLRVDKCEYKDGRGGQRSVKDRLYIWKVDRYLSSSSEMRRRSRVQVPHHRRADLRVDCAK